MKKIFTLAIASMMAMVSFADDLFVGPKHVSWDDGGVQIAAEKFAGAKAGNKIVVTYTGAKDGIEFKVMNSDFSRLPGSLAWKEIDGDASFEQFLTPAAVAGIKEYGLEIIGADFNVQKVELLDGKDNVTENTVWTGFFWMDSWSTVEIVKSTFDGINWSDYKAIRFCSEAGRTNYDINVMVNWESDGKIADQNSMTMTNEYAELSLDGVDMPAFLAKSDRLMVQCNKKDGSPFNFTSIELVPCDPAGISNVTVVNKENVIYDLKGCRVNGKAKGIVIINGRKHLSL